MGSILAAIINWNGGQNVVRCVRSLLAQSRGQVSCLVIDNASTDGSGDTVRAMFPGVKVVILPQNTGYACGVNAAIREFMSQEFDFLLVLNNDVECHSECIDRLMEGIQGPDVVVVVGPGTLRHRDNSVSLGGIRMGRWRRSLSLVEAGSFPIPSDNQREADRILGAAMLISREAIKRLGGFDGRMFLTWEETDFCLRVWRVGGMVATIPDAEIIHDEETTTGRFPAMLFYYLQRNRLVVLRRNLRLGGLLIDLLGHLGAIVYEIVAYRRCYYRALLLALFDGLVLVLNTSRDPRVAPTVGSLNDRKYWRFTPSQFK